MARHVPPSTSLPEQIVLRSEVIDSPLAFARDSLLCLFRVGLIVGYDEPNVQAVPYWEIVPSRFVSILSIISLVRSPRA